jgi:beta-mannosidase
MNRIFKTLHDNGYFTQVGGSGEGKQDTAKEGECLPVDSFPTTVHVELIKLKRTPDPVESYRFIA